MYIVSRHIQSYHCITRAMCSKETERSWMKQLQRHVASRPHSGQKSSLIANPAREQLNLLFTRYSIYATDLHSFVSYGNRSYGMVHCTQYISNLVICAEDVLHHRQKQRSSKIKNIFQTNTDVLFLLVFVHSTLYKCYRITQYQYY